MGDRKYKTPEEMEQAISDLNDKVDKAAEKLKRQATQQDKEKSDFDRWFYGESEEGDDLNQTEED